MVADVAPRAGDRSRFFSTGFKRERVATRSEMSRKNCQQPNERLILLGWKDARIVVRLLDALKIDIRAPFDQLGSNFVEMKFIWFLYENLSRLQKRDELVADAYRHGGLT